MKDFFKNIDAGLTISDENGIITYMNEKSAVIFEKYGGFELLNKKLSDCHPDSANAVINEMMASGKPNIYSIEKNGKKKIICQYPYQSDSGKSGLIELSIELPDDIKHFVRT
jgi:transcriptional regulator with PAS, ATPase and Fis domain